MSDNISIETIDDAPTIVEVNATVVEEVINVEVTESPNAPIVEVHVDENSAQAAIDAAALAQSILDNIIDVIANMPVPTLQSVSESGAITDQVLSMAGLILNSKLNFITSSLTAMRNVSFQDKDGIAAYTSDITALSQTIASKQSAELLLLNADVVQSGGLPKISGLTIQGHTLTQSSRVIVTGYNVPAFNGIYRIGTGPIIGTGEYLLVRTSDANVSSALNNAIISVTNGNFAGKTYRQTAVNPVIGTTAINFVEFGGSTVSNATDLIAGITKLYNALGSQTDGGITPKAVNDAIALKADLIGGLIPSSQLPAYVDDVLEFANLADFPVTGEIGKIYVAIAPKNLQYRWSGSSYIQITNGLIASTDDVPEGSNLYFTVARVLAALLDASDSTKGVSKLYNAIGSQVDGGITPNGVDLFLKKLICIKSQTTDITTNSVTMINTSMSFDLEPNSTYIIDGYFYGGGNSGGGLRFGWSGLPVGINGIHSTIAFNVNVVNNGAGSSVYGIGSVIPNFAGASNIQQTRYVAYITTGSIGGTIIAQVATGTGGQTAVFRTLSSLKLTKQP